MTPALSDYTGRIWAYLAGGGIVMIPLMAVSFVMWVLIINRAVFFRRLHHKNMSRRRAVKFVKAGHIPDPHAYRGVIAMLVSSFLQKKTGTPEVDVYILDEIVMGLTASLDRHLAIIAVLAQAAPLLGLLGTVLGMIATFDILSFFGTGNAKALAGGISEALITTQIGLLIAIPGLYMSHFLKRRAERLKQRIASVGMYLARHV